ncbi:hypothetical protein GCM10008012_14390 [Rhizobium anhuiense]|nr:hypothetical protein GCM10008012_14390 [Rhizobium anhuiense]
MPGDEDNRQLNVFSRQLELKIKTALSRKPDIEYETGRSIGSPGREEVAHGSEEVDGKADRTQQTPKRLPDLGVIIDNNDGR